MSNYQNSEAQLSANRGEACLILPATMADVEVEHEDVLESIIDTFGGFTLVPAIGGWKNPAGEREIEPVVSVTIAMQKHSVSNDTALENIADSFGQRYKQKAMYIRYADGRVSFRPVPPPASQAGVQSETVTPSKSAA